MKMQSYIDEIKLALTGGVLELEVADEALQRIVISAMREIQRYITSTKIITLAYKPVIDLTEYKVNAVTKVLRASEVGVSSNSEAIYDPVQLNLYQYMTGSGTMYNYNNYISRLSSWNTLQQVENTLSTDLAYYFSQSDKLLYINTSLGASEKITIEYVPRYDNVEEITSDYWIDILTRLSIALAKIYIGRIRSRFTQSNALWGNDGETLLNEGNTELTELRNYLQTNSQLIYCYD